jgi:hypothetical protein
MANIIKVNLKLTNIFSRNLQKVFLSGYLYDDTSKKIAL